jgi:hypothetical protein
MRPLIGGHACRRAEPQIRDPYVVAVNVDSSRAPAVIVFGR